MRDEIVRVYRHELIKLDTSSWLRMDWLALISNGSIPAERTDASAMVVFPIPGGP
jgi:hypothetical protein